jgi:hypothetical protein
MRLVIAVSAALAAAFAAAPVAAAAPPPKLVSPADGRQYEPPVRAVTFTVDGQPDEADGALHIEMTDPDGETDATGRYTNEEGGVDDFVLKETEPGSGHYRVRVGKSVFTRYGGNEVIWHAYRVLPEGSCTPVEGSSEKDCFQESNEDRTLENSTPQGWGAYEPNPFATRAASGYDNHDCAYLETRTDADWYRFSARRAFDLKLRVENLAGFEESRPLSSPKRESGDMSLALYRSKGKHGKRGKRVAWRHVKADHSRVIKRRVRKGQTFVFAVRHAGNGHPHAKPADGAKYSFSVNRPGGSDFFGC